MNRKMRMGMVGGGIGAFIGAVHRMAAGLDNEIELVCGAFSSDPERSRQSGEMLYLPASRVYPDYRTMILEELKLPEGERMDFISIVTPNHVHFGPAKMALEHGFHVVLDKPMTLNLQEAVDLKEVIEKSGLLFCLTHNYTGYPMVKQARDMIAEGKLGKIRKIVVEYPQGWLNVLLEATGQKQAEWRTDPARSGAAGCIGDIGTHAFNMAEYMTGLKVTEVCADLTTFVEGRKLEDDANLLLRFENGAKGVLHSSQISVGEENNFNIRVYGEVGGLWWHQMEPNTLEYTRPGEPKLMLRTGVGISAASSQNTRLPAGHPEGYIEAFANVYRNFAKTLRSRLKGETPDPSYLDFPGVESGLRGMKFIDTVIRSNQSTEKWTKFV
ncbi:MAG: Gfo/Idh/MocA family oxidoreductase [Cytophagales bacterium]|nr:Gfo/Idh/MocA family oxidoreductase [Cytophagales bacterium]